MSKYISGIKSTSFSLDVNGIVSTTNIPSGAAIPGVSLGLNSLATAALELNSTGTASYIDFAKIGVDYAGRILYDHGINEMQIFTNLASSAEVFINSLGNVGIGGRSATYKLETTGDIMARNSNLRTTGNTGMYNDTYGSGWYMADTTAMRVYNDKHIATAGNIYITDVNPTGVINLLNNHGINFQTNSTANKINFDAANNLLVYDTSAVHNFYINTALQTSISTLGITIPNGKALYTTNIDSFTQNVAVGYYTIKSTQSVATFNVYNNNTDKLVMFAVNTAGTNGGANNIVVTPPLYVNNALLVANSTGVENLLQNMATTSGAPVNLIMPNLSVGNYTLIRIGTKINSFNTAELSFTYAGSGSTANAFGIGFYGVLPLYNVTAAGAHKFIGSNAAFAIPVTITNTLTVVNSTNIENTLENMSTTSASALNLLMPNLNVGSFHTIRMGVVNTQNNTAELRFIYNGVNSTANMLGFGFYNVANLYAVTVSGIHTFTGSNALFSIPVVISSTLNSAALTCTTINTQGNAITSGNITASMIIATNGVNISGGSVVPVQGIHLQWNRNGGSGTASIINQQGLGIGGFEFLNFNNANVQLPGKFTLDTSGNGVFTGVMTSASIATGAISSAAINTNTNSITCGAISSAAITSSSTINAVTSVTTNYVYCSGLTSQGFPINIGTLNSTNISSTSINTNGYSITSGAITAGPIVTSNIDSAVQNVAIGYYTIKSTQSVPTFNVYNNSTDKLVLFAVNTAGTNGGANNIVVTPPLVVNNVLTVLNSSSVENTIRNLSTVSAGSLNLLMPNLNSGANSYLRTGVSIGYANAAELFFNYVGSGNTANTFNIGFIGIAPFYNLTASGIHYFTGINALFDIPVVARSGINIPGSSAIIAQGTYLQWNRNIGSGTTSIINQQGSGGGGFEFLNFSGTNVQLPGKFTLNTSGGGVFTGAMTSASIATGAISSTIVSAQNLYTTSSVGIGNNNPGFPLDVTGNVRAIGGFFRTTGDTGLYNETYNGGWYMTDTSAVRVYADKNIATAGSLFVQNITSAGSVNINSSNPTYRLDVGGDIMARNAFLRTTGNTGFYNDTYNGGWYMTDTSAVRVYADKNIATAGNLFVQNATLGGNMTSNTLAVTTTSITDNYIQNTSTASTVSTLNLLAPNVSAGNSSFVQMRIGTATNANNTAEIRFNYQGNQSTSNYLGFTFYGMIASLYTLTVGGLHAFNGTSATFNVPTTINSNLTVTGTIGLSSISCHDINTNGYDIATYGGSIACGAGAFSANYISCNGLDTQRNTIFCGSIDCRSITTNGYAINTSTGAINTNGGSISCGAGTLSANYLLSNGLNTQRNIITCGQIDCYSINANGNNIAGVATLYASALNCNGLNTNGNIIYSGAINCHDITTNGYGIFTSGGAIFTSGGTIFCGVIYSNGGISSGDFSTFGGGHTLSGNNANAYCNGPGVAGTGGTGNTKICAQFYESVLFSNGWFVNSDARIKTNITYNTNEHDILLTLQPCTYNNIDFTQNNTIKHGLIAQEVEAVFPEAVTSGSDAIPDIMKLAEWIDARTFKLDTELPLGKIRLYVSDIQDDNPTDDIELLLDCNIIEKKDNIYTVDKDLRKVVFVYGTFIDDFKSIEYNAFVPLLISGYKAQDARIKQLEAQMQILLNK